MPSELIVEVKHRVASPLVPAPLSESAIADAEAKLGLVLPPLLRELYHFVGDGGFGPGYGLLSLNDAHAGDLSVVTFYLGNHGVDPSTEWPTGLLAFCHWGCNIYSCVDCVHPPNPVLTYEFVEGPIEYSFAATRESLESWLRDWLAGQKVFESVYEDAPENDRVATNPFTKKPFVIKGRRPRRR